MTDVSQRVLEIVADCFHDYGDAVSLPGGGLRLDHNLIDDLGFDSIDVLYVVLACEEAFDISIDDDVADDITTVQGVVDAVRRALGEIV